MNSQPSSPGVTPGSGFPLLALVLGATLLTPAMFPNNILLDLTPGDAVRAPFSTSIARPVAVASPVNIEPVRLSASSIAMVDSMRQHLAAFIASEWHLGLSYTRKVVDAACAAAGQYGVNPILILAVAAKETGFRHIGNPDGGADPAGQFGIMQVFGRWHPDKFSNGVIKATGVVENMAIGTHILRDYLALENGDEARALLRYNGSLGKSDQYPKAVFRYRDTLSQAALDGI